MQKKNLIKLVSFLLCVTFATGIIIGYSATPTNTTWLQSGSLTETSSYVIWPDGSNYFVKDGSTGKVTSSTNASDLISTYWNLGNVYLKAGTYSTSKSIIQTEGNYRLEGESYGNTIISYSGTDSAIIVGEAGEIVYNLIIDNVKIVCTNIAPNGLTLYGLRECAITNIELNGASGATGTGIYVAGSAGVWTATSLIENTKVLQFKYGITLASNSSYECNGWELSHCYLLAMSADTGGLGVSIQQYTHYTTIHHVLTDSFYHGYSIQGDHTKLYAIQSENDDVGLYITTNAWGTTITGYYPVSWGTIEYVDEGLQTAMMNGYVFERYFNKIPAFQYDPTVTTWDTNQTGFMWFDTDDKNVHVWDGAEIDTLSSAYVYGGSGFINSGTSTVVNHYTGQLPDAIIVTMTTDGFGDYYISSWDANTFTLTVNNTGSYYFFWQVIVNET